MAAIRVAADGGSIFAPSVTRRLIEEFTKRARREAPPELEQLTPRELEVLRLIAGGLSNHEIAAKAAHSRTVARMRSPSTMRGKANSSKPVMVVRASTNSAVRPYCRWTRSPSKRAWNTQPNRAFR